MSRKAANKRKSFECVARVALAGLLCAALVPVSAWADAGATSDGNASCVGNTMTDDEISELVGQTASSNAGNSALGEAANSSALAALSSSDSSNDASLSALASSAGADDVSVIAGETRYETSALQAQTGWPDGASTAILACGEGYGWVDALAASSLAGALDCPVLLTAAAELSEATRTALESLGVSHVIIVGGTSAVSDAVANACAALPGLDSSCIERIYGQTRFDTQLAVYERGRGLWSSDLLILARGWGEGGFADALSASPVAFSQKSPVFITDDAGCLTAAQELALVKGAKEGLFKETLVLGGEVCVSAQTEGFCWAVSQIASGISKNSVRIAGETRMQTSAQLAKWACKRGYLSVDNAAFSSGFVPWDALGGGVLQGKTGSVLLLLAEDATSDATDAVLSAGGASKIRFLGGEASVSKKTRSDVLKALGFVDESSLISYTRYDITLSNLLALEQEALQGGSIYTDEQLLSSLDPNNWSFGDSGFYQFAVLSDGYSGKVSAADLNAFIDKMVVYQESNYGVRSTLRGAGAYFIAAAQAYNVNEVYLLANAALESAWGCSKLAQGQVVQYDSETGAIVKDYRGYYNFFGIGAYDRDPLNGGAALAEQEGWSSVEAAILGAAKWLSKNYLNPTVSSAKGSGAQNTLYKMRWDVLRAAKEQSVWHQYATGRTWATGIASVMAQFYSEAGISMKNTGLRFDVPVYKG